MQNSSVFIVSQLDVGVQPALDSELLPTLRGDSHFHVGLLRHRRVVDGEHLFSSQVQLVSILSAHKLQRQDAHAHQVRPVDSLIRLSDHSLDALQLRSLCGPVS